MRLLRLVVDQFRVIDHAEVELGPGLNVLYGPNDIGKSTLMAALRAALLLPCSAAEGTGHASWLGDESPRVELTFLAEDGATYRVTKRFGGGARGSARLERSRDGESFDTLAVARQVEEKLRELLRWGVPSPGGRGQKGGLPEAFLATTLLGEQTEVDRILGDSLAGDTTDSGRQRLQGALEAFAQDPRFKAIFTRVQHRVDDLFTSTGRMKSGKGTPMLAAQEQLRALQQELDGTIQRRKESDLAERRVREQIEARAIQRARHTAALEGLAGVEAARAATQAAEAAQARLQEATSRLQGLQARRHEMATSAGAVAALEQASAPRTAALEQAGRAVAAAREALEQARLQQRRETSDEATAARQLQKATLEAGLATRETAASELRGRLSTLDQLLARQREIADRETRRAERDGQLQAAGAEEKRAARAGQEAEASHAQLADLRRYVQWDQARQDLQKATQAAFDAEELAARARVNREEEKALRTAAQVRPLPELEVARSLVHLEQDLKVAQAGLGGGLTLSVRGRPPAELRITADGLVVQLPRVAEDEAAEVEAGRQIELLIPDLLEVEILAGDQARRRAAEALQKKWKKQARPVLQAAGVGTARELEEACNEREARLQKAAARGADAEKLERQSRELQEVAGAHQELGLRVTELETLLEGRDLALLGKLKAGLKHAAASEMERTERALETQRTQARDARAAAGARAEGLRGQLAELDAQLAAARDALAASLAGQELAAADLAGQRARLEEQGRKVAAESGQLRDQLQALSRKDVDVVERAGAGVEKAEATLQRATQAEEVARTQLAEHRSRLDRAAGEHAALVRVVDQLPFAAAEEEVARCQKECGERVAPRPPVTPDDVERARQEVERSRNALEALERDLQQAHGALTQVGGAVIAEKQEELQVAVLAARDQQRQLETDAAAWRLLGEVLRQAENTGTRHVGRVLADQVGRRFSDLTARRYGAVELDADVRTLGVQAGGGQRTVDVLSAGTREQLATLLRLSIAESLQSTIVLDDHLVQSDPDRLGWFVQALQQATRTVQVIVVTCRRRDYELAGAGQSPTVQWLDLDQKIRRFPARTAALPTALRPEPRPAPDPDPQPDPQPEPDSVLPAVPDPGPVPDPVPAAAASPAPSPASVAPVAPAAPATDDGRPFSELLGHALDEMGASSEDFARSVMAGHRVVQLWLKGGSMPAAQLRPTVIEFLLRGRGTAAENSARARAAAHLASLAR